MITAQPWHCPWKGKQERPEQGYPGGSEVKDLPTQEMGVWGGVGGCGGVSGWGRGGPVR